MGLFTKKSTLRKELEGDNYAGYRKVARGIDSAGTYVTNFIRKVNYQKPIFDKGKRIPKVVRRGTNFGRRGRPRGTLDPRYAKFGGVYGYRKYMSQVRALERIRANNQSMLSPEEQQRIAQFRQQQIQSQQSPENQVIPDTNGRISLKSIHDEADDYANLVP